MITHTSLFNSSLECGYSEPEQSSVTFTLSSPAKVYLSFDADYCAANFQLIKPKLECGEYATPWSVESDVVDSRIDMSREAITLQLRNSGINLTNQSIELLAGKVTFGYYDNGTKKTDKIWIDNTNGALHAVDGIFSGKVSGNGLVIGDETSQHLLLNPSLAYGAGLIMKDSSKVYAELLYNHSGEGYLPELNLYGPNGKGSSYHAFVSFAGIGATSGTGYTNLTGSSLSLNNTNSHSFGINVNGSKVIMSATVYGGNGHAWPTSESGLPTGGVYVDSNGYLKVKTS